MEEVRNDSIMQFEWCCTCWLLGLVTQGKIEDAKNTDNFPVAVNVSGEKSNIIHVEDGVSGLAEKPATTRKMA